MTLQSFRIYLCPVPSSRTYYLPADGTFYWIRVYIWVFVFSAVIDVILEADSVEVRTTIILRSGMVDNRVSGQNLF